MERFALAGLLAVAVPSFALAQRVEISMSGGAFKSLPHVPLNWQSCVDLFRPDPQCFGRVVTLSGGGGGSVGGHLTLQFGPRFGVDASVVHARTSHWFTVIYGDGPVPQDVATTLFALQPRHRHEVNEWLNVTVGGGPALSIVTATTPGRTVQGAVQSGTRAAFAFSLGLQGRLLPAVALEVGASSYTTLNGRGPAAHNLGVGLTYALH